MWLHACSCVLSKLDHQLREGEEGAEFERDRAAAEHFLDLADLEMRRNFTALTDNADTSMLRAAEAALKYSESIPNESFVIPERSPNAMGTGRTAQAGRDQAIPGRQTRQRTQTQKA